MSAHPARGTSVGAAPTVTRTLEAKSCRAARARPAEDRLRDGVGRQTSRDAGPPPCNIARPLPRSPLPAVRTCRCEAYTPPSGPARASARAIRMGEIVGAGELLGHDDAPGLYDELAGLGAVQCRKVGVDPVEAHIRGRRHLELVRLARDERRPLLLGEREAHHALVAGERHVDDLLDAELQPAAYVHLVGALQPLAQRPNVLDHRHAQNPPVRTRARPSAGRPVSPT